MTGATAHRRLRSTAAAALAAALVGVLVAGCTSAARLSPPTGVDGLVVPTPSPHPADFVAGVDNPWTPMTPGTTWTYDVVGATGGPLVGTVRAAVGPLVQGVATTAVRTTLLRGSGAPRGAGVDLFAQDTAGDVWWFGHRGAQGAQGGEDAAWRAGVDGARAGLVVTGTPRLGDGYRAVLAPGVADDRATVAGLDGHADVPAGTYDGVLVVDVVADLGSTEVRRYYARGVGLVERQDSGGAALEWQLRSVTGP